MRKSVLTAIRAAIVLTVGWGGYTLLSAPVAAQDAPHPYFRATFKAGTPPKGANDLPITQALVANPHLMLTVYGPGTPGVEIAYHAKTDPAPYVWTGLAKGSWIMTLKDKDSYVDLSGPDAKIRWSVKEAGYHLLRPVLKLADGTLLAGEHTEGYTADWQQTEFPLANMRWRKLDPTSALEARDGKWVDHPDLSKVDEVGFTDLSEGTGHGAGGSTRVQWIEVYGKPVPR